MSITMTPVASSVLLSGDSISFLVDDTYTTMLVEAYVDGPAWDDIYDSGAGGSQSGYTVSVTDNGDGTHTFVFTRDAGWNLEPQQIRITEDENDPGGATTETTTSYFLGTQRLFPQGSEPLNPLYVGTLIVTENNVQIRDDVGWIEFDPATFNVADSGNGKVTITAVASGAGDVVGPGASTDDALVVWDGEDGELVKDSTGTIAQIVANTAKTTNATHSGDVSGATTLTIGAKKVTAAMMADGTDGELFTWDTSGVLAKVAVGTATHVLTSNGLGNAPTFQVSAAGTTLDALITGGTPDNDVDVPTGDPIIFRDGGTSGTTPLKVAKAAGSAGESGTPAALVEVNDALGIGIKLTSTGAPTDQYTDFLPSGIYFGNPDAAQRFYSITGHSKSGATGGCDISISGGANVSTGDGGDVSINAGASTSGTDGEVLIGNTGATSMVRIGGSGAHLSVRQAVFIKEQASADADVTAYGQVWVDSGTGHLSFTGEDGVDHDVIAGLNVGGKVIGIATFLKGDDAIGVPDAGEFDVDNATIASITSIRFLASNPQTGAPINGWCEDVEQTGTLILQDVSNPGVNDLHFNVASHVLTTSTYWDLTVTLEEDFGTNWATEYSVQFIPDAGAGGGGGGFTDAPDAALFTERADHVNTPAAGFGEHWSKNTAPCTPIYTDDAATDHNLISREVRTFAADWTLDNTNWKSWSAGGPYTDFIWAQSRGAIGGDPSFVRSYNGIYYHEEHTLEEVELAIYWTTGTLVAGVYELWGMAMTDDMSSDGAKTKYASVSHTNTAANRKHLISMAIDVATIPADTQLALYFKRTDTTGSETCKGMMNIVTERTA